MFSADSPAPDGALSPAETILNSKFVSTTGSVFPRGALPGRLCLTIFPAAMSIFRRAPYRLCQAFFKNT